MVLNRFGIGCYLKVGVSCSSLIANEWIKSPLPKAVFFVVFFSMVTLFANKSLAQSTEAQQLLLNVEKLSQLKNILSDMKKGYLLIFSGYKAVKDIAEGNFSLHEVFLDGMMLVSPEIKKYHKVADIITGQSRIVSEYKRAFKRFQSSGNFSEDDIAYLAGVYKQLFDLSMDNLDELMTVITSSTLRMSDQERLAAIDRIFADTESKLIFLRSFNDQVTILDLQRSKERADVKGLGEVLRTAN